MPPQTLPRISRRVETTSRRTKRKTLRLQYITRISRRVETTLIRRAKAHWAVVPARISRRVETALFSASLKTCLSLALESQEGLKLVLDRNAVLQLVQELESQEGLKHLFFSAHGRHCTEIHLESQEGLKPAPDAPVLLPLLDLLESQEGLKQPATPHATVPRSRRMG